jgi:hypothetical protein
VQTQLGYESTTDTSLQYLRDVHEKFLSESIGGPSVFIRGYEVRSGNRGNVRFDL